MEAPNVDRGYIRIMALKEAQQSNLATVAKVYGILKSTLRSRHDGAINIHSQKKPIGKKLG